MVGFKGQTEGILKEPKEDALYYKKYYSALFLIFLMRLCVYAQVAVNSLDVLNHSSLHYRSHYDRKPRLLSGVCAVRVKTRSSILTGNDPVNHFSSLLQYLNCFAAPLCLLFTSIALRCASPLLCLSLENSLHWNTYCALCQLVSTHCEDVCETLTQRGYKQLQEAALGTNQAENPLIPGWTEGWPLDVLYWHVYGARWSLSWGLQEDTTHRREEISLEAPWQGNKVKALIPKLHNHWVHAVYGDWRHVCLQWLSLWSLHFPLFYCSMVSSLHCHVKYVCILTFENTEWDAWIRTMGGDHTGVSKSMCVSICDCSCNVFVHATAIVVCLCHMRSSLASLQKKRLF